LHGGRSTIEGGNLWHRLLGTNWVALGGAVRRCVALCGAVFRAGVRVHAEHEAGGHNQKGFAQMVRLGVKRVNTECEATLLGTSYWKRGTLWSREQAEGGGGNFPKDISIHPSQN